jgi:Holliday junction resolvasome RuvABC ATP-dependent DNA helicase subunit
LQLAESINQNVLVKIHKNKKETIRIQIRKMKTFKQFMTVEDFNVLSRQMISTHMKKIEVVPIMRELA